MHQFTSFHVTFVAKSASHDSEETIDIDEFTNWSRPSFSYPAMSSELKPRWSPTKTTTPWTALPLTAWNAWIISGCAQYSELSPGIIVLNTNLWVRRISPTCGFALAPLQWVHHLHPSGAWSEMDKWSYGSSVRISPQSSRHAAENQYYAVATIYYKSKKKLPIEIVLPTTTTTTTTTSSSSSSSSSPATTTTTNSSSSSSALRHFTPNSFYTSRLLRCAAEAFYTRSPLRQKPCTLLNQKPYHAKHHRKICYAHTLPPGSAKQNKRTHIQRRPGMQNAIRIHWSSAIMWC